MDSGDKLDVIHTGCFTVFVLLLMILIFTNCEQERKADKGLRAKKVYRELEEIKRIMTSEHDLMAKALITNRQFIKQEKCGCKAVKNRGD